MPEYVRASDFMADPNIAVTINSRENIINLRNSNVGISHSRHHNDSDRLVQLRTQHDLAHRTPDAPSLASAWEDLSVDYEDPDDDLEDDPDRLQLGVNLARLRGVVNREKQEFMRARKEGKKDTRQLHLLQLNAHHSKAATAALCGYLTQEVDGPWMCLVQEPHVAGSGKTAKIAGLPGLRCIFAAKCEHPRALIYADPGLHIWEASEYTTPDMSVVVMKPDGSNQKEVYFASVYWDCLRNELPDKFEDLLRFCNQKEKALIIGMDSNAHGDLWGCATTDTRGGRLEEMLLVQGVDLCNVGTNPTFVTQERSSIIDLTLQNSFAASMISNWHISNYNFQSDHVGLTASVKLPEREYCFTRALLKADWPKFAKTIGASYESHSVPTEWNEETIECELGFFLKALFGGLDEVAPERRREVKVQPPWWNEDLAQINRRLQAVPRSDPGYWHKFRRMNKEFKKATARAKRLSWQEFTSSPENCSQMARLSKILQRHPQAKLGMLRKTDGLYTSSPEEAVELLMKEHFPDSTDVEADAVFDDEHGDLSPPVAVTALDWISPELTAQAISTFGALKAAGPDTVRPLYLQKLPPVAYAHLSALLTACVFLEYTPKSWCELRVVFVPKPGKDDYSNPRAFRPIALTSFIFKTLERMVHWVVEAEVLPKHPMDARQHAFRRGFSTETLLADVIDKVEKGLADKQLVLSVFLDVKGAFSNINVASTEAAMARHEFPKEISGWYSNYLHRRVASADINGVKARCRITKGTSQGGILSPLLWNLCFDTLLGLFPKKGPIKAFAYADDGHLMIVGFDLSTMVAIMNVAITKVLNWGRENGLEFCPRKTQAMVFTGKQPSSYMTSSRVMMDGVPMEFQTKVRYLGVVLDNKLSWTEHIKAKIGAAKRHLHRARSSIGALWGPQPGVMRWAYTGIVRPAFTYGCVLWAQAALKSSVLRKGMASLQRLALMQLGHFRKSTPGAALEVAFDVMPLHLHVKELAMKASLRVHKAQIQTWIGRITAQSVGHVRWARSGLEKAEIPLGNVDSVPTTLNYANKFVMDSSSLTDSGEFKAGGNPDLSTPCIFTDGSGMEEGIGCGFVVSMDSKCMEPFAHSQSYSMGSFDLASVFQAEVGAILKGAEYACNNIATFPIGKTITFLSDSQAALQALSASTITSALVNDCVKQLNSLAALRAVRLVWIKAHQGHEGNEVADGLAGIGARLNAKPDDVEYQPFIPPIPKCKAVARIHDLIRKEWRNEWCDRADCRQSKLWFPEPNTDVAKSCMRLSRKNLSTVIRWTTGHCFLRYHEHLQDEANMPDPSCRLCGMKVESSFHVIAECEETSAYRAWAFQSPLPFAEDFIPSIDSLVEYLKHMHAASLESDMMATPITAEIIHFEEAVQSAARYLGRDTDLFDLPVTEAADLLGIDLEALRALKEKGHEKWAIALWKGVEKDDLSDPNGVRNKRGLRRCEILLRGYADCRYLSLIRLRAAPLARAALPTGAFPAQLLEE